MLLHRGNLYLVGLMGAGKTTLGRQLARRLAKRFVDADHELEERLGVNIPTIFEIEGEASFRDREEAVIADLVLLENVVLGTGRRRGAARGEPRALAEGGTVVYLHADPRRCTSACATAVTGRCCARRTRPRASPSSTRNATRCTARSPTT
jgi:shikimate kinase